MSQIPEVPGWAGKLRCTKCQHPLAEAVQWCPWCGADLRGEPTLSYRPRPRGLARVIAWAALGLMAVCVVVTGYLAVRMFILGDYPWSD
jgi:hypothetical protein